jgi:S1-C subfamily serine protease
MMPRNLLPDTTDEPAKTVASPWPAAAPRRPRRNRAFANSIAVVVSSASALCHSTVLADECDQSFADVFDANASSVVRIFTVAIDPFSVLERVQTAVGTGFVIDDDGHVVTNAHMVFEATQVLISISDGELLPAVITGIDPITDVAVVQFEEEMPELQAARLGRSSDLRIGEEVIAIGFPFGIGKTATHGIISALERVVPLSPFSWRAPFIQTDAAINPGNSGGPLIDSCGNVIGVNTLSAELGESLGFAVPVDLVRELLPDLIENGHISRAWHGINGRIVPLLLAFALGVPPGFLVETVEPGSPADDIGLRGGSYPVVLGGEEYLLGGDVILSFNGTPLVDMETVNEIARSLRVGEKVELEYLRDGMPMTAEVVLPERPMLPGDVRRFRERRSLR